jgi:Rrf2 family protein
MLLSKTVVHGVYILCYLNRQDAGSVVPSSTVAEAMGVPPEQAAKILQVLAGAGIVESVRGRKGGYAMKKTPEELTMGDLIDALGPADNESRLGPRPCPVEPDETCSAHAGLMRVHARIRQMLDGQSLAPVIEGSCSGSICVGAEQSQSSSCTSNHD